MSSIALQISELLNTLDPAEKSYVKKTFGTNEKYMSQLFNDLNKCAQFDKKTFHNQHKKRSYMKYLTQNCKYLFKRITKSLIDYNTDNLTEINIMARLSTISLLVKKGMFSACLQKIDKEVNLAETFEYYEYGYKLIKLKERFYKFYLIKEFSYEEHKALAEKKQFFIQQLQLIDELELLTAAMENTNLLNEEKLALIKETFTKLDLLTLENLPGTAPLLTKNSFNYILYKISLFKEAPNLEHLKQSLKDFDNKSFLKKIFFETYVGCITRYFEGLISNKQYDLFFNEYEKYMIELKNHTKWKTMKTSPIYYTTKYYFFIRASVEAKQSGNAVKKAVRYQQVITKTNAKLTDSFIMNAVYYNAHVFYNSGYLNETLDAIELLKKHKNIKARYFFKVMQILCHYKLGNIMLVDSLSNSLVACLRKHHKTTRLKDFLKLKKCLLHQDCEKLDELKFLPYLDLNTLKTNTYYINAL